MTPLEKARKRQQESNGIYTCFDCKNCVKVGGWWYCEDSGKMLHPMMLERVNPLNCERGIPKEVYRRRTDMYLKVKVPDTITCAFVNYLYKDEYGNEILYSRDIGSTDLCNRVIDCCPEQPKEET